MRRALLTTTILAAVAIGAFGLLRWLQAPPGLPDHGPVVAALSKIPLRDGGNKIRRVDEFAGKPMIINFWATWCAPCRREIPLLIQYEAAAGGRVQVLGIAVDRADAVRDYVPRIGINYPVLMGEEAGTEAAKAVWPRYAGLPFTAFTDSDGRLLHVTVGEMDGAQLTAAGAVLERLGRGDISADEARRTLEAAEKSG